MPSPQATHPAAATTGGSSTTTSGVRSTKLCSASVSAEIFLTAHTGRSDECTTAIGRPLRASGNEVWPHFVAAARSPSSTPNLKVISTENELPRKLAVRAVPYMARQTLRSLAAHSRIPKTTLVRHMKEVKTLNAKSSYSKPLLTEDTQRLRVEHALSFLSQSLQHQKHSRTINDLIENTENSYDELPMETLSKTFITLQKVMEKTLETFGTNDYKIPHMNKNAIKDVTLYNVRCDPSVHKNAVAFLSQRPLNSQKGSTQRQTNLPMPVLHPSRRRPWQPMPSLPVALVYTCNLCKDNVQCSYNQVDTHFKRQHAEYTAAVHKDHCTRYRALERTRGTTKAAMN
ncbi:hypothetical protein H257_10147 [Aphanomyces astaci]|uniref:Uncharacterized protein n=1 Tax=Aphanomyces astaci TaxID=112090 RepID=W4G911_APHAT|nr:hypothetical protein H257_10147 [Aphanomyces astaci]ETV75776.1 hypothetical protein H257_10147 [Aphanomyces astaci]|eukprot:XP_009834907.1 hypothetical protein H257_10147 [Aphanomyces astaci]